MSMPNALDGRDQEDTLSAEGAWKEAQSESRFASAGRMRLVHTDLLGRDDETESSAPLERDAFLNRAWMFLMIGEKTGAILDDSEDRWAAQSQLDYWYNVLYRAGKRPQRPKLAPFDEEAVPSLADRPCPYRGLAAFDSGDHDLYFGRQELLNELMVRIAEVPLVAVVGSSGSGKSSLVRAGLIPALRSGRVLEGSDHWLILPTMLPGSNPLENLARTLLQLRSWEGGGPAWFQPSSTDPKELGQTFLARSDGLARLLGHGDAPPVVLFIDQFEEVFTLCDQPDRTQAFLSNLLGLLEPGESSGPGHRVVLTMRSDFEVYLMKYPEMRRKFERGRVQVTPLERDELRDAIEEPARGVGLVFERSLVDRLIDDTFGEPGSLPLLQFTLTRLWQTRRRNKVLLEAYAALGGARLALATVADLVFKKLIREEQDAARRIFLRIVRPGQGLEVTNQRIAEHELFTPGEDHDRIRRVLDKLVHEGLVRTTIGLRSEDTQIEVAHEALVRNWPLLVGWLNEERAAIVVRQRLADKVAEWVRRGRGEDALLDAAQLADAERWLDSADAIKLGAIANLADLIAASREAQGRRLDDEHLRQEQLREAREREENARAAKEHETALRLKEQQEANRRLRQRALVLLAALIATIVLAGLSVSLWRAATAQTAIAQVQTKIAQEQTCLAESRRLAASSDAVRPARLDLSLLLALEAVKATDTLEARRSLEGALNTRPEVVRFLDVPDGYVMSVAFGPESKVAAGYTRGGGLGGGVVLFDARGARLLPAAMMVPEVYVTSVAFGPEGTVAAGYIGNGVGGVALFGARGARLLPTALKVPEGAVTSVAFGPEGKIAAGYLGRGADGGVVLYDAGGARLLPAALKVPEGVVRSVAFGPEGKIAAGYEIVPVEGGGMVLFDARGERLLPGPLAVKEGHVMSVAFGPEGKIAAGYGVRGVGGGGVVLFDARGARLLPAALKVPEGSVMSVAFGPEGKIAAGYRGGVILLDARGERLQPAALKVPEGSVTSVAFATEGKIAAGYDVEGGGGVLLIDTEGERQLSRPLEVNEGSITSVAFGPEGKIAAGYGVRGVGGGGVVLFDTRGERRLPSARKVYEGSITSVAFGPEGKIAAGFVGSGAGGGVVLFDARGARLLPAALMVPEGYVTSVAIAPTGQIAAGFESVGAVGSGGGVVLFDAHGERLLPAGLKVPEGNVMSVAFGLEGQIAAGYYGGVVLFDARGERLPLTALKVKEGAVTSVAFGPTGQIAAGFESGGAVGGGGVVLFDARGERVLPAALKVPEGAIRSVAFAPTGKIAAGYRDVGGRVVCQVFLDVNPASWPRKAGQIANRNFTRVEWTQYFPQTPYRRTIRSLPWPHDLPEAERKQAEAFEKEHPEGGGA